MERVGKEIIEMERIGLERTQAEDDYKSTNYTNSFSKKAFCK